MLKPAGQGPQIVQEYSYRAGKFREDRLFTKTPLNFEDDEGWGEVPIPVAVVAAAGSAAAEIPQPRVKKNHFGFYMRGSFGPYVAAAQPAAAAAAVPRSTKRAEQKAREYARLPPTRGRQSRQPTCP